LNRSVSLERRIESATRRWDSYMSFASPKRLVVHPDDWYLLGCPLHWEGVPVKPLGITL